MCCKLRTRRLLFLFILANGQKPELSCCKHSLRVSVFATGKVAIVETCESRAILDEPRSDSLFFSAMNLFKKQRLRLLDRRLSAVQDALERRRTYPYLKISFLVDRSSPLRFNRTTKLPNDTSITSVFYICICIYIHFTCNCW